MIGQRRIPLRREAEVKPGMFQFAAIAPASPGDADALVVDRAGRIVSCGGTAEQVFGARRPQLIGRRISEFVAGLFLGGSSPSYGERYLAYLCATGDWRKYEARDVKGRRIPVELHLSRTRAGGQESFLLRLRCSHDMNLAREAEDILD
ncbi:MAG: PAS domain S-box protein [Rhodocyclaceae bacterium]|nr:PAS domain S-box protein [Rhodocyclaceae bacterium]